jgi:hypothetical protein
MELIPIPSGMYDAALSQDVRILLEQVYRYNLLIVGDSLAVLHNRYRAELAWNALCVGIKNFPETISYAKGTFADHRPVMRQVIADGFEPFYDWLVMHIGLEHVIQQAVLRNMHHFVDSTLGMSAVISPHMWEALHREFAELDYEADTYWLSRFFHGFHTAIGEVYIVMRYLDLIR